MMRFHTSLAAALIAASSIVGLPALAQMKMAEPGDAMATEITDGAEAELGALKITGGYAFATLPNSPVAGGFLTVTNTGDTDDTLIAAASDIAGMVQIHEMSMDGDIMKMRELEDGLPIPAGGTVQLMPGGFHVMFMKLKGPLVDGEEVTLTLTFEKAGDIQMTFPIKARPTRRPTKKEPMTNG